MRVVIDTNVLVRALMNPAGTWGDIVARSAEFVHVMSPALIAELLGVVRRPRLKRRFGQLGQQRAIELALAIIQRAEVVVPVDVAPVARDRDDDQLLACAIAAGAKYIITEDDDLLALRRYRAIRIVRAAEFLRALNRNRA